MEDLVRKVIARYQEGPNERPSDDGLDWMQYVKEKSSPKPSSPGVVEIMLKDLAKGKNPGKVHKLDKPFDTYNPYDYKDPNDKPKDLGDSPPFVNHFPQKPDTGLFMHPKILEDGGLLQDWYKARRQDWTQNSELMNQEENQGPAISITRHLVPKDKKKRASATNVVAKYMARVAPIVISEVEFEHLGDRMKLGASLREIATKDVHYKNDKKKNRAEACSVTWANRHKKEDTDKGLFIFNVNCPPSNEKRIVYFQFLRGEGEKKATSYIDYPVTISCSCESFLFYGAQYYAAQEEYLYFGGFRPKPNIIVPPKEQTQYVVHKSPYYPEGKRHPGRGLNFRMCKHILAAYNHIKTFKIETFYREYPVKAPPSKVINADVWKNLMKFEFTEENIKDRLTSPRPKIPAYFRREDITPAVIEWFKEQWIPMSDDAKIKRLRQMVESPERIFFILMKEAYLKSYRGEKISDRLIDEGYKLMSKMVQPDNKLKPIQTEMPGVPEEFRDVGRGTWISEPGGTTPASDFIEQKPGEAVEEEPEEEIEQEEPEEGAPSRVEEKTKAVKPKTKGVHDIIRERADKIRKIKLGPKQKEKLKELEEKQIERRRRKRNTEPVVEDKNINDTL